jgi:hypothetical protein
MGQHVLPNSKLKFVHKVDDEHAMNVEVITKSLDERVL